MAILHVPDNTQEAIEATIAASQPGDEIHFMKATYLLTRPIVLVSDRKYVGCSCILEPTYPISAHIGFPGLPCSIVFPLGMHDVMFGGFNFHGSAEYGINIKP